MKLRIKLGALLMVGMCQAFAGNLTPLGPPGPTMKTLDEFEARTPIAQSDIPLVISASGSYYLAESITCSTADVDAIQITSHDGTLDLNGYSLIVPGRAAGSSVTTR